jgi:uncharacterized protein YegL
MLVLDSSGSMSEKVKGKSITRIEELNLGLRQLQQELVDDETARLRVQLAIVQVGGPSHNAELLLDWTDAKDFEPPTLQADGPTPLAHGMRLALHHVAMHKATLGKHGIPYTRPWVMVISDGEPSDSGETWDAVCEECRKAESAKRCVIFPIGVEDARLESIQKLSSTRAARLSSTRFNEYFKWLSASLQSVSRSRSGDSVVLPTTDPWTVFT